MPVPPKPTEPAAPDPRAAKRHTETEPPEPDPVDAMSEDSFPASDPPSFTHTTIARQERRPKPDVT